MIPDVNKSMAISFLFKLEIKEKYNHITLSNF